MTTEERLDRIEGRLTVVESKLNISPPPPPPPPPTTKAMTVIGYTGFRELVGADAPYPDQQPEQPHPMTDAALVNWMTVRHHKVWLVGDSSVNTLSGGTSPYNKRGWSIRSKRLLWNGKMLGDRVKELGGELLIRHRVEGRKNLGANSGKGVTPFPLWHDDAGWTAFMLDLIAYYTEAKACGFSGAGFDAEITDGKYGQWNYSYPGHPTAMTMTLLDWKRLMYRRGKQWGTVLAQVMPNAQVCAYEFNSFPWGLSDQFYAKAQKRPQPVFTNEGRMYFLAGMASVPGIRKFTILDHRYYITYANPAQVSGYPGTDAGYLASGAYNAAGLTRAFTDVLAEVEPNAAQRKLILPKIMVTPLLWLNGHVASGAHLATLAEADVAIKNCAAIARWADTGGQFAHYLFAPDQHVVDPYAVWEPSFKKWCAA